MKFIYFLFLCMLLTNVCIYGGMFFVFEYINTKTNIKINDSCIKVFNATPFPEQYVVIISSFTDRDKIICEYLRKNIANNGLLVESINYVKKCQQNDIHSCINGTTFCFLSNIQKVRIVWLNKNELNYNNLNHEFVHVAVSFFKQYGVKLDDDKFAYFIGNHTSNLIKQLQCMNKFN